MTEILSFHERAKKKLLEDDRPLREAGTVFRILFCGGDRRGMEVASSALARAFLQEGFYAHVEETREEPLPWPAAYLRVGREIITERGFARAPCLVVAADDGICRGDEGRKLVKNCLQDGILLIHSEMNDDEIKARLGFVGTVLKLPVSVSSASEPWFIGSSCAGGAARLVGNVAWTSLETGLRNELVICDVSMVHRNLARALEAFDRLAPWAGSVLEVAEELDDTEEGGIH